MTSRPYDPKDDDDLMAIAEQVCTPKQLEVLALIAIGYGNRRGARILEISETAWKSRRNAGLRRISQARKAA